MSGFLVDENVPLAPFLALGADVVHVTELGAQLTDEQVWGFARDLQRVIVTKDADFFAELSLRGAPPKVVWIRTGNLRLADLQVRMAQCWTVVEELLRNADLVIIHPDRVEGLALEGGPPVRP